ncbi:MerR family transcriptional regulator [Priestia megaterium]|nr:MerR family transcriptional regulator [Priestia megaterium]
MENKFTIGEMSKLHHIPIKTLRYYDEIGLFTPFEVDPQTGYRYYTLEQFKKLDLILYLKMLGVPLKEIKKKVEYSSLDEFIQMLTEYRQITEQKINELTKINGRVKERILELERTKTIKYIGKPLIKSLPDREIIEVKRRVSTLNECESILRDLKKKINHITPIVIGKVGFILSADYITKRQFTDYEGMFLLVEEHVSPQHELITVLPSGTYASVYMREPREKEEKYYQALLTYINEHGYQPDGPFLIRQIVDSAISYNEEERLKEIQIRIKPLTVQ